MFPWLFKHATSLGPAHRCSARGAASSASRRVPATDRWRVIDQPCRTFGFYETDGTWGIEGHGVEPDIEVVDDPTDLANGVDTQLMAAIEHLLTELETNAYQPAQQPTAPDRSGFGITEEDK